MTKIALVIGSTGGIGQAVLNVLRSNNSYDQVIGLGRSTTPHIDLFDEGTIQACAQWLKTQNAKLSLIFDATGGLTIEGTAPEKSLRQLDPANFAKCMALNAIGPALLLKHFSPLFPKDERAVFASLSARVGSIGDNALGGWYSYRAAKAALNQVIKTASIELLRNRPNTICVALHPGTVRTPLTEGFAKTGLEIQEPEIAASRLLEVVERLTPKDTGKFFDHFGKSIVW